MRKVIIAILLIAPALVSAETYGSNFLTGGTASADSTYSTNVAGNALDANTATPWTSALAGGPHWWKYDLGASVTKTPAKVNIWMYKNAEGTPIKEWKVQGSNDDSNYSDLFSNSFPQTQTDETITEHEFTFTPAETSYRYIRIYLTDSYRAAGFNELYELTAHECTSCASTSTPTTASSSSVDINPHPNWGGLVVMFAVLIVGGGMMYYQATA